jgi:hypothetical protein
MIVTEKQVYGFRGKSSRWFGPPLPLGWSRLAEDSLKALTAGPLELVNDRQNLGKLSC